VTRQPSPESICNGGMNLRVGAERKLGESSRVHATYGETFSRDPGRQVLNLGGSIGAVERSTSLTGCCSVRRALAPYCRRCRCAVSFPIDLGDRSGGAGRSRDGENGPRGKRQPDRRQFSCGPPGTTTERQYDPYALDDAPSDVRAMRRRPADHDGHEGRMDGRTVRGRCRLPSTAARYPADTPPIIPSKRSQAAPGGARIRRNFGC
jgi:hypothetical protein